MGSRKDIKGYHLRIPKQEIELPTPARTSSPVATTDQESLDYNTRNQSPSGHSASSTEPNLYDLTPTPTPPLPPRSEFRPTGTDISISELSAETPILQEAVEVSISWHPTPTPINASSRHPSTSAPATNPGAPSSQLIYPLPPPSPTHLLSLTQSVTYTPPSKPTYLPKHNPSTLSRTRQANLLLLKAYLIHKTPYSSPCSPTSPCPQMLPMSPTSHDLDKALYLAETALQKARQTGRPNLVAKCHQFRGFVLRRMGRWGEAYGDFVRAASVPRFAADAGEEGMGHMLEGCVRTMGSSMIERLNTTGRDGRMVGDNGTKDVGGVETPEPHRGLMKQGTFGSGSVLSEARTEEPVWAEAIRRWSNSFHSIVDVKNEVQGEVQTGGIPDAATTQPSTHKQHRQKPEEDEVNDRQLDNDSQCAYTSHPLIVTHSGSAVEQPRTERTTSVSTTQTFYTAFTSQPSASTYHTASTHPEVSPIDHSQAENDFHGLAAWHITNSTTSHDDVYYRVSSTSPAPIYPLTPIQDFPRPFYRRDDSGRIILPSAHAPPPLRKVRGMEFEGKYWLLSGEIENL